MGKGRRNRDDRARSPKAAPSTADRLANDLEEGGLHDLAKRARTGEFDDYRSPHAMPQHELIALLTAKKEAVPVRAEVCDDFIKRVIDGEYDSTTEESDAWAASPEGQAAFKALVEGR